MCTENYGSLQQFPDSRRENLVQAIKREGYFFLKTPCTQPLLLIEDSYFIQILNILHSRVSLELLMKFITSKNDIVLP